MAVIARVQGGFAQVATTIGVVDAGRRESARHRAARARSRALCEDLAERLSWLQRPDDPDVIPKVAVLVRNQAAALALCVGRLSGSRDHAPRTRIEVLAALVDAIDAEMRLAVHGDAMARARARCLSASLSTAAATLVDDLARAGRAQPMTAGRAEPARELAETPATGGGSDRES
jgi:hypothetical protein